MTTSTPSVRGTRVSPLRVFALLLSIAALGWLGTLAFAAVTWSTATPGPSTFRGYVDVTAWPTYAFETPDGPAQSDVTLSFIVANPTNPCEPSWGGYYSMDEAASELELDRRVQQLRDVGGHVGVSFGGQANSELATVCTDPDELLAAYRSVIDHYGVTTIDLDIEGAALEDSTGLVRRAVAIAALQAEAKAGDAPLDVWLTLPVGATGLTDTGEQVVAQMLATGVDVTGVNGMAMDFGIVTSAADPQSTVIIKAANALHEQVLAAFDRAGEDLSDDDAWGKVGITTMIGQNDVVTETFTLTDATAINKFALDHGVGLVSIWSLNRDATCTAPLPSVLTVVQTSCSGVNQDGALFAEILAADLPSVIKTLDDDSESASPTPTPTETAPDEAPTDLIDDPATSPYPIWDALGTYPAETKIVWRHNVYQARYWTSGVAPDTAVSNPLDSPWILLGPVLPGDTPAPLPTLPAGTYPDWTKEEIYVAGDRVLLDQVPYEAKWWTQGQEPGTPVAGGSAWVLILPSG